MKFLKDLRTKNFIECKEMAFMVKTGDISLEEFEEWSKENCTNCSFWVGKPNNKHCLFGKVEL